MTTRLRRVFAEATRSEQLSLVVEALSAYALGEDIDAGYALGWPGKRPSQPHPTAPKRLKELVLRRGYTLAGVARELQCCERSCRRWWHGETRPQRVHRRRLRRLVRGEDPMRRRR